ncbi:MAG TPA: c-type cytochrome biogenesis protein CcsB [Bacteroidales bacterium]|nr:c-type cytochrome biogenesis protein CcsB [Bacteroidales bacterium]
MKYLKFFISPVFMGVLFILFAVAMAAATFIENDYGSAAAYGMVYDTRWFELILLLLAINLVGQLIVFRLFKPSRISGALFHLSFIIMLAGAAITRYTGWEGSIHIRENEEQNVCYTTEKYLGFVVSDNTGNNLAEGSREYSGNNEKRYEEEISAGNSLFNLKLVKMIPNAATDVVESPGGEPVASMFVMTGEGMSGESLLLKKGERKTINGVSIGFDAGELSDLTITVDSGKFFAAAKAGMNLSSMMTKSSGNVEPGKRVEMQKMQILAVGNIRVIPRSLSLSASLEPVSMNPSEENTGQNAFVFELRKGNESRTISLWNTVSSDTASAKAEFDGKTFLIRFGSLPVELPFTIKLNDFILERYPGSNSPSGYKSDVMLIDKAAGVQKPFLVYMNNILKYKGYRFYQSSFDQDEKGTVLSVNHDVAGMLVTYTGYGLLFLFIIITLINRNSIFHKVTSGYWNSNLRKAATFILILLAFSGVQANAQKLVADKETSDEFGKVLVQDQKGRTKPLFTLSSDILRKVTKESRFEGLTPMQVFLGLYLDFNNWKDVPLISISNRELKQRLGISGNRAAFSDLVKLDGSGTYKISNDVENAYNKAAGQRTKLDKEVMKIDERVNIIYMIYNGNFMRMFPLRNGTHDWGSPEEALKYAPAAEDSAYLKNVIPVLASSFGKSRSSDVKQIIGTIKAYQEKYSGYDLPASSKTGAELLYYRLNIFEKLFPFYATIGILMLGALIAMVIRGKREKSVLIKTAVWILFAGFLLHTFGLALRWYISGHSPMSNGYESMLFISWVTLLAGFIFSRKTPFALSATAVLGSMTLLVAHMSFMDPEITNLVPVLKSYWLTLHVSVITGSYGFLGLGAILGLIVLILLSLENGKNRQRISETIDELTVINYKTLTLGLYLLTIGTFLGAVWANESWGRYWGWDPKETWSLITIIIYSIVIHSRLIPGMKDIFTFNLISLFAFSSVLMTYFGVNYYLSGLHSYAAGDAVPVPTFVYITVIVLGILSFYAQSKYRKIKG